MGAILGLLAVCYTFLIIPLLPLYWSPHLQNGQQNVRGAVLGLLVVSLPVPYHSVTIALMVVSCAEMTARCEGSRFRVLVCVYTISSQIAYHFLTNTGFRS